MSRLCESLSSTRALGDQLREVRPGWSSASALEPTKGFFETTLGTQPLLHVVLSTRADFWHLHS
jgi:hypothetical protein